jgi:DNA repair exonuclease SbcCD ATPase subunit
MQAQQKEVQQLEAELDRERRLHNDVCAKLDQANAAIGRKNVIISGLKQEKAPASSATTSDALAAAEHRIQDLQRAVAQREGALREVGHATLARSIAHNGLSLVYVLNDVAAPSSVYVVLQVRSRSKNEVAKLMEQVGQERVSLEASVKKLKLELKRKEASLSACKTDISKLRDSLCEAEAAQKQAVLNIDYADRSCQADRASWRQINQSILKAVVALSRLIIRCTVAMRSGVPPGSNMCIIALLRIKIIGTVS